MLVDHVRADTSWVDEFTAAAVVASRGVDGLTVACGVEAKLLDTSGALDLPTGIPAGVRIFAADHQVPTPGGPGHPREIRAGLTVTTTFGHSVILFAYPWLACSMIVWWAAKAAEGRTRLKFLAPPLLYLCGYRPLLCHHIHRAREGSTGG